ENGEQGLKLAKRLRPRVITLDVVMPGIDGWAVLKRLKADADVADIPVIMVTIVDNSIAALDRGASSYLVKPVDREALMDLIQRHRGNQVAASSQSRTSRDIPVGVSEK